MKTAFSICMMVLAFAGASLAQENWYGSLFRKAHLDYHLNPWIRDAASAVTLDEARRQMRMMKDAGIQSIEIFARDHFGAAFYPSEVITPHPSLRQDYFGNMTKAAHEQGIKVVAYVCVFTDVYMRQEHPDWYVVDRSGHYPRGAWLPEDNSWLDVSSPFVDKVLKPMLKEVVTKYSPDAIWLDGGSWLTESLSYSSFAREWYRGVSGEDIPNRPAPDASPEVWRKWTRWRAWRRSLIATYLQNVSAYVHSLDPRILVSDNSLGNYDRGVPSMQAGRVAGWLAPAQLGVDFLSFDAVPAGGNHAVILSRVGRYQATFGMPFDLVNERFQGWGEWDLRETTDFKQESATILSVGAHCLIADQPWPDGTLEPEVYRRIKSDYQFVQAHEDAYRNARLVSDIGILASETTTTLAGDLRPLAPAKTRTDAVDGAALALTQEGIHFRIFSEANLGDAVGQLRVLIVPEQAYLLDSTVDRLRAFVEAGGRLFLTGQTGRFDWDGTPRAEAIVGRLAGISIKGIRRAPVNYYELASDVRASRNLPAIPMMVRGPMYNFEAPGGAVLAQVLEPRDDPWDSNGQWRQYTVTGAMPPKSTPAGAAAVLTGIGKGQVLYAAGNWFATYHRLGNPSVRKMLAAFLSRLFPENERMLVVQRPLRVDATLMRTPHGYVITMVNSAMQKQSSQFVQAEEIAPAADLVVSLKVPETVRHVRLLPGETALAFRHYAGRVEFTIPKLDMMALVEVACR